MTAANADDFLRLAPGAERSMALAMIKIIVDPGWSRSDTDWIAPLVSSVNVQPVESLTGIPSSRIAALAQAFVEAKASVALAGPAGATGPAAVETAAAAALLNVVAERVGQTVDFAARTRSGSGDAAGRAAFDGLD